MATNEPGSTPRDQRSGSAVGFLEFVEEGQLESPPEVERIGNIRPISRQDRSVTVDTTLPILPTLSHTTEKPKKKSKTPRIGWLKRNIPEENGDSERRRSNTIG